MLEAFCSFEIYVFMMQDFSFKMVKGSIDDWEVCSMNCKHQIVVALVRMLAEGATLCKVFSMRELTVVFGSKRQRQALCLLERNYARVPT